MTSATAPILHFTNGDSAAQSLRDSGIPGEVVSLRDVLHDGPARPPDGAAWRELRADFLQHAYGVPRGEVLRSYEREDAALDSAADHGEVVLWFDHELLDQLQLARALHVLATPPLGAPGDAAAATPVVSLVCIDRFPGVEPFIGLGQLQPAQLAALFPRRVPLTPAQLALGARLWRAYTAGDPGALEQLLASGVELAFLAPALRRFLEEYPWTRDGLPRTERTALEVLAGAAMGTHELFRSVLARERWLFMGDSSFGLRLLDLGSGPHPLVRVSAALEAETGLPRGQAELTDAGRAVLSRAADAITLNGFDRWLGGVHLRAAPGEDVSWRWDQAGAKLARPGRG